MCTGTRLHEAALEGDEDGVKALVPRFVGFGLRAAGRFGGLGGGGLGCF